MKVNSMKPKQLILMTMFLALFTYTAWSQSCPEANSGRNTGVPGAGSSSSGGSSNYGVIGQPTVGVSTNGGYTNQFGYFYDLSFTPNIITTAISSITAASASSGGNISDDAGLTITGRGIVWSASPLPALTSNELGHSTNGSGNGSWTQAITGLTGGMTYYVRAYAVATCSGTPTTFYADQVIFTTIPTLPEWGIIALMMGVAGFGGWIIVRRYV